MPMEKHVYRMKIPEYGWLANIQQTRIAGKPFKQCKHFVIKSGFFLIQPIVGVL